MSKTPTLLLLPGLRGSQPSGTCFVLTVSVQTQIVLFFQAYPVFRCARLDVGVPVAHAQPGQFVVGVSEHSHPSRGCGGHVFAPQFLWVGIVPSSACADAFLSWGEGSPPWADLANPSRPVPSCIFSEPLRGGSLSIHL